MFRKLRWHLAKMDMALRSVSSPSPNIKGVYKKLRTTPGHFIPNAEPYDRLAALYNDYARWLVPAYGRFLAAAGRYYGQPVRCVLDLACGTGLVSRQLARRTESVVGLDISEAMLQEARSRTAANNVRYIRGDFRGFCLAETFDATVCGTDALNYLEKAEELVAVFRCVGRHLRPGGLFAFDVMGRRVFRRLADTRVVVQVNSEEFQWYDFYDSDGDVSETRVIVQGVVERHRRIPIDEEDVCRAAGEARLEVVECFSNKTYLFLLPPPFTLLCFYPAREFYLLRKGVS